MLPRSHVEDSPYPDRIQIAFDDHRLVSNAGQSDPSVHLWLQCGDCIWVLPANWLIGTWTWAVRSWPGGGFGEIPANHHGRRPDSMTLVAVRPPWPNSGATASMTNLADVLRRCGLGPRDCALLLGSAPTPAFGRSAWSRRPKPRSTLGTFAFDDHRLVANAGLILPSTLAWHLGLPQLVDRHLDLGRAPGGANTGTTTPPAGSGEPGRLLARAWATLDRRDPDL